MTARALHAATLARRDLPLLGSDIINPRIPSFRLQLEDFEIGEVIGIGTVGTIYEAQRKGSDEDVAIKLLLPNLAEDDLIIARFEREMTVLQKLNHPNIIRYFGGGRSDGQLFFVMEIVRGGSVRELLNKQGPFTWQETVTIGRQLASALQHAHNHGVIHRDIKPSNLLLTKSGELKLSDFGIAHDLHAADLTESGLTVGSHLYMSPEQITGNRRISGQTDLYSTGCVLFEMLSGSPPFNGEHFAELFERHLHDEPPSLRDRGISCPPKLDRLIQSLLAKRAGDRPFNARAVQGELIRIAEESLQSAPVEATAVAAASEAARSSEIRTLAANDLPSGNAAPGNATSGDVAAGDVFAIGKAELVHRIKQHELVAGVNPSWLKVALLFSWILIAILIFWVIFR